MPSTSQDVQKASGTAPVTPFASRVRKCDSTAKSRARRRSKVAEKVTASSEIAEATCAATRSEGAIEPAAREEAVMRIVALDLGKRRISYCEVKDGQVFRRLTVSCIETLETELGVDQASAVVAIEACRKAWHVHDLLTSWGNKVIVVDTTRVRRLGVGQHGRKTDRVDAEVLAFALERGGIPMAHVLSPARRELRRWLGVRRGLVETRAQLITTARGICRELGQPLQGCVVKQFLAHVRKTTLSPEASAVLTPLLKTIETVSTDATWRSVSLQPRNQSFSFSLRYPAWQQSLRPHSFQSLTMLVVLNTLIKLNHIWASFPVKTAQVASAAWAPSQSKGTVTCAHFLSNRRGPYFVNLQPMTR